MDYHETYDNFIIQIAKTVADPEISKRGGPLCRPPWMNGEEKLRFKMV